MEKLPEYEVNFAARMILWFARGCGETGIYDLAAMHILDTDELQAWVRDKGYLFDDGKGVNLAILPSLWAHYAPVSRVCQAFHEALNDVLTMLGDSDNYVTTWVRDCEKELSTERIR